MATKFILINGTTSTHQNLSKSMDLWLELMFNNLFVIHNSLLSPPEPKLIDKSKENTGSSVNNHLLILMHLMYSMLLNMDQLSCNGKVMTILSICITNTMPTVSKFHCHIWKSIQPIKLEKNKNILSLQFQEEVTIKQ